MDSKIALANANDSPNIFDIVSSDSVSGELVPFVTRLINIGADRLGQRGWMFKKYVDELVLCLNFIIESRYLFTHNSSLGEHFYELVRVSKDRNGVPVSLYTSARIRSLFILVIIPYVKQKISKTYNDILSALNIYQQRLSAEGSAASADTTQETMKFIISLGNRLRIIYDGFEFLLKVFYMLNVTEGSSIWHYLAGIRLRRVISESDSNGGFFGAVFGRQYSDAFTRIFGVMLFGLRIANVWHQQQSYGETISSKKAPMSIPKAPVKSNAFKNSLCPLCNSSLSTPTVLPACGLAFCFKCIYKYVVDNGCCPITKLPASSKDLGMVKTLSLLDSSLETIVEELRERYTSFLGPKIYTNFGSILVAINPLYLSTVEFSGIYGHSALNHCDAHIYAVAKKSLDMLRPLSQETIVVIGDSGSGKTVTVGHALDFLTTNTKTTMSDKFFEKILTASHLMELFANAQTCLNTNSSRFGKLISLIYRCGTTHELEGANVEAFLLEKSRVTSTPEPTGSGENFHILRLLVSKLEDPILFEKVFAVRRQKLESADFSFRVAPFNPDLQEKWFSFDRARHLLSTFDCDDSCQLQIFRTLAVILHLCNLQFISRDESLGCEIAYHFFDVHTSVMALQTLLGVSDCREIQQAFTTKPVTAMSTRRQSVYRKSCGVAETEGRRNSVARFLYIRLFEFVMHKISSSVEPQSSESTNTATVSVLDIFGFENFTLAGNDFEQLCINFCNEKIQQHFAKVCINDVYQEMKSEGMSEDGTVHKLSYTSNDGIISLFEGIPSGIFCILDEKCRLNRTLHMSQKFSGNLTKFQKTNNPPSPQVTGDDFFETLAHHYRASANSNLKLPTSFGTSNFTIKHYAGEVSYSCQNFVEKSRDDVSPDLITFLTKQTTNSFIAELLSTKNETTTLKHGGETSRSTPGAVRKKSLASKYRTATSSLISFLSKSTNVHYIRCIRPNDKPANVETGINDRSFDVKHVSRQLECAGLVDVIKLSSSFNGLNRKFSYLAFTHGFIPIFRRFQIDVPLTDEDDKENTCDSIDENRKDGQDCQVMKSPVQKLFKKLYIAKTEKEDFFFGRSKLFLSDKLLMFFRRLLALIQRDACIKIQMRYKKLVDIRQDKLRSVSAKINEPVNYVADTVHDIVQFTEAVEEKHSDEKVESPNHITPSIPFTIFIDGDIMSRRRIMCLQNGFRFHVRPNPLLQGAHLLNKNRHCSKHSITDCLD